MADGVLGIPDPWIWLAYLLSIGSAVLCVVHAIVRGRKMPDAEPTPVDTKWVQHEKEAEEE